MGTVYRRGDRWRAEVHLKGLRRSGTFGTKREAMDWIGTMEESFRGGKIDKPTMRDAIDKYLKEPGRSRWDDLRLTAISKHAWAALPLDQVTAKVLSAWRDDRLKQVAPNTVIREMTLLRALFEAARRDWEWLAVNPIADVRKPAAPPARQRLISDAERDDMLTALGYVGKVQNIKHEAAIAFLLALETGMRAGEILALEWADIDLAKKVATLHKSKTGPGRGVPLSKEAVRLFGVIKGKKLTRLRTASKDKVFHLTSGALDTTFRRARKDAALSGFTFHDSRATAITRLSKVLEPLELARMVGHSDLSSLLIYYRESAASIALRLD